MILPVCEEPNDHTVIVHMFDDDVKVVVNSDETDLAMGIALAFARGKDTVHIKYEGTRDSIWRMLSFLACVHPLETVDIHRCEDGMIITTVGD